jgi:hypothetical protein
MPKGFGLFFFADDGVPTGSRSPAEDCEISVRDEAEVAIFRGGCSVPLGAGGSA